MTTVKTRCGPNERPPYLRRRDSSPRTAGGRNGRPPDIVAQCGELLGPTPEPADASAKIDPALPDPPIPPAEAVASLNASAPGAAVDSPPAPSPVSAPPRSRVELRAGMAAAAGLAPSLSLGPTASVSLRGTVWDVGVEGWADLPSSGATDAIQGPRVRRTTSSARPMRTTLMRRKMTPTRLPRCLRPRNAMSLKDEGAV